MSTPSLMRLCAVVAITACFSSGCALTTATIPIDYMPQSKPEKLAGAEAIHVSVSMTDARKIKDRVSSKKNGYGMEMAAIIAENDVGEAVRGAVQTELANRGFAMQPGGLEIQVELRRFYNDFKMGFFAGDAAAEVEFDVLAKRPDGSVIFQSHIEGEGMEKDIQMSGGDNAKLALEAAFRDAVGKLFEDRKFVNALMQSAPAQQPQVTPPPTASSAPSTRRETKTTIPAS